MNQRQRTLPILTSHLLFRESASSRQRPWTTSGPPFTNPKNPPCSSTGDFRRRFTRPKPPENRRSSPPSRLSLLRSQSSLPSTQLESPQPSWSSRGSDPRSRGKSRSKDEISDAVVVVEAPGSSTDSAGDFMNQSRSFTLSIDSLDFEPNNTTSTPSRSSAQSRATVLTGLLRRGCESRSAWLLPQISSPPSSRFDFPTSSPNPLRRAPFLSTSLFPSFPTTLSPQVSNTRQMGSSGQGLGVYGLKGLGL